MSAHLHDIAATIVGLLITLPSAYLAFLAAVSLLPRRARPRVGPSADRETFAILVPAHDEERVIARTLASLAGLEYPRDRFSVHVVADNCSDDTAAIARDRGTCVHERTDPHRPGKGAALNWLVDEVLAEHRHVDAFVIVDADSELSPDFLHAMGRHLRGGAVVAQALNLVKVVEDRPLVRIRELAFELGCHLRPLAYERLGGSSGLFGNGMCIDAALCRRYRWSESSVVEDAELFLRLVRGGYRVELATDATVRSTMPVTLREAGSQALRWERGRFDYVRELSALAATGLRRRDLNALCASLAGFNPPLALLAPGGLAAFVIGTAAGWVALTVLATIALACLSGYVLRGAVLGGLGPSVFLRILVWAPSYCLWKAWVLSRAAFGVGRRDWQGRARGDAGKDHGATAAFLNPDEVPSTHG